MCCTVASRLYFNGHTTRIEYIGGVPSGDEALLETPLLKFGRACAAAAGPLAEAVPSGVPPFELVGNARLMGGLETDASGMNEEADDLSDRRLLVRATDLSDGSELAEETEGDSLPASGEDAYDRGDWRWSTANFGEALI